MKYIQHKTRLYFSIYSLTLFIIDITLLSRNRCVYEFIFLNNFILTINSIFFINFMFSNKIKELEKWHRTIFIYAFTCEAETRTNAFTSRQLSLFASLNAYCALLTNTRTNSTLDNRGGVIVCVLLIRYWADAAMEWFQCEVKEWSSMHLYTIRMDLLIFEQRVNSSNTYFPDVIK